MLTYDTETCGLTGPLVFMQYAVDDGPIVLYDAWYEPVGKTMDLIEWMMTQDNCGFNLVFDHFQLQKFYTMLHLYPNKDKLPIDDIMGFYELESDARFVDICLKPKQSCDVMLHARKTHYQSLMERDDIRIRKVPVQIAFELASFLEENITFDDIYFARRKDKYAPKWSVNNHIDRESDVEDPKFKDIVLVFKASTSLKNLAVHALNIKEADLLRFSDNELKMPKEIGYAPFAKAVGNNPYVDETWPVFIKTHAEHWKYNTLARRYGTDDVIYTRGLYNFFGSPDFGDDDSELATMVGSCRWYGFNVDVDKIKKLRDDCLARATQAPMAPTQVMRYITAVMEEKEAAIVKDTKKVTLETISKDWVTDCICCDGLGGDCEACAIDVQELETGICVMCDGEIENCEHCGGSGEVKLDNVITTKRSSGVIKHPAALRCKEVLDARKLKKEVELYDKLIKARRLHASFKITGTLSNRMSGADKLNPQGIKKTKEVRQCFDLADKGFELNGGDFDAFEVCLADAAYNCSKLRAALVSGKKIHGLFGVFVYPHMTYDEILASEGTDNDVYTDCKRAVFAMLYGGDANTLCDRLGVTLEIAERAFQMFARSYPGVAKARMRITNMFQALRQPDGIGSKIHYKEPHDYVESLFGYRRYFTLENQIVKALFSLAQKPPPEWKNIKGKVVRRDRVQEVIGAMASALYGAAFSIQGRIMRAAANHEIQSSGSTITKHLQRRIWDLQPTGVNPFKVLTLNIHDELMVPAKAEMREQISVIVKDVVEQYRARVPLLGIKWKNHLPNWGSK